MSGSDNMPVVSFKDVDIVFGDKPAAALPMMDAGKTRQEIQEATGQILGVAGATFDIHEGEVLVLMGLSGSGKSTLLRAVNGLNPVIRGEVQVHDGTSYVNPETCSDNDLRELRCSSNSVCCPGARLPRMSALALSLQACLKRNVRPRSMIS
jgi:glycine betaine/proline transport system ATP-binding protein